MLIAQQMGPDRMGTARLLALVNTALADAGVAVWESKYHYAFWRPVTGVRESDPGTGPSGLGDGNADTLGDPSFTPLGAPASNLVADNFTPPFPAYPSGYAGFGGALFETLRRFYGTDAIPLTLVSDEFDGMTRDNQGSPRRCCRAASRRCRRRRRRTARAASTSASTGPSTRRRASRRDARWPTTCSSTRSGSRARMRSVARNEARRDAAHGAFSDGGRSS